MSQNCKVEIIINNISDEKVMSVISDYYHEDRTAMGYDAKRNLLWAWYSTDTGMVNLKETENV